MANSALRIAYLALFISMLNLLMMELLAARLLTLAFFAGGDVRK